MRKQMQSFFFGIPAAAIEVESVLGQTCEIHNTEVAAARRPHVAVRKVLTEIIKACPDKFSYYPRFSVLIPGIIIGNVAPRTAIQIVTRHLPVGISASVSGVYSRKMINSATAERGSSFACYQKPLRQRINESFVAMSVIIESRNVE